MIDPSLLNHLDTGNAFTDEPNCPQYKEFWDKWLELVSRNASVRRRYCNRVIKKNESQLKSADASLYSGILAVIAQARSFLATALHEANSAEAEPAYVRAVLEARQSNYARVTFNTSQALAIFYAGEGRLDDSLALHMLSLNSAFALGTPMTRLLLDRIAYELCTTKSVDAGALLYECLSFIETSPIQPLKHRAKRLRDLGAGDQLVREAEEQLENPSCWDIAKTYVANLTLGRLQRATEVLSTGIKAADLAADTAWVKAFSREQMPTSGVLPK